MLPCGGCRLRRLPQAAGRAAARRGPLGPVPNRLWGSSRRALLLEAVTKGGLLRCAVPVAWLWKECTSPSVGDGTGRLSRSPHLGGSERAQPKAWDSNAEDDTCVCWHAAAGWRVAHHD